MSPVVRPTRHSIICEAAPNKKADSAAKRARQAKKRRVYNKARKSEVKNRMKKEYELDGIEWTKVDFEDHQECLDLFEKKPIGLISLLDGDSNFPKATDLTFANKLKQHLSGNPCFKGEKGGAFGICHYAGEISF
ncbi:Myosin-2 [Camellia lanceoleosa]|uniref:Myosin-2 n=1 Tax=Camellia lanceoleosa TaxID=1840588 RepID=A0ACC0HJB5_9ERIC|nr:Myosin-2 [Camellia lanceoleosa]